MSEFTEVQLRFKAFVYAREEARLQKEAGFPRPWSSDQLIATYKFCNVNREHDAVTRWIEANVRSKLRDQKSSLTNAVFQLYLCRVFNEPTSLELIMPVTNPAEAVRRLGAHQRDGKKILRGAYLVVPHGAGGKGRTPEEFYMSKAVKLLELPFDEVCSSLADVASLMETVDGIGDFMANQVCTDLRYLRDWPDWTEFVLAGPGTRRGVNRFYGEHIYERHSADYYSQTLRSVRTVLHMGSDPLPDDILEYFRDINNLSNCFCEFDKYERARDQWLSGQRVSLRPYKSKSS